MWPKCVLLDRDGVINADSKDYILTPSAWTALPGSLTAIADLHRYGAQVGVCTNQSAVGRGWLTTDQLDDIHRTMRRAIEHAGGTLAGIWVCPHAPDAGCACRKPAPGLILSALEQLNCSAEEALMIGDSQRDVDAAQAAGIEAWCVRTGNGLATEQQWAKAHTGSAASVPIFDDLRDAVNTLIDRATG